MSVLPFAGLCISGKAMLTYLNELRSMVGENSVLMVLRKSGWLDGVRSIISTRHEKTAPYEALVAINQNISEIFGEKAQRTVVYSSAKRSFAGSFGETKVVQEAHNWIENNPQSPLRLRASLEAIIYLIEQTSDQQIRLDESSSHYHLTVQFCAACWGVHNLQAPYCYYNLGIIRGGLQYIFGNDDYPVQELACVSSGDKACEFIVRKFPFSENEIGSGKTGFLTLPNHLR
ncbi:MAG: hypothetical protein CVU39_08455 [Chloroflexi bacterium HGW-Chloroflexi-10]|nr:MAG: hypothetical protein CVU39_08455 [Chloroflexi bacterium HGW-Chloroflexi-10]